MYVSDKLTNFVSRQVVQRYTCETITSDSSTHERSDSDEATLTIFTFDIWRKLVEEVTLNMGGVFKLSHNSDNGMSMRVTK